MNYRECYSRLLYLADRDKSATVINNDTFLDSADVYERIFLSCTDEVFILARGIKDRIFKHDHVIEAASSFIKQTNAKLNIILRLKSEDDYDKALNTVFIDGILQNTPSEGRIKINFYEGDEAWLSGIGSTTIGDNRIYRYRYLQDEYRSTSRAKVCFNDEETCSIYKNNIQQALDKKNIAKHFSY